MSGPEHQRQPPDIDETRSLFERAKEWGSSARAWFDEQAKGVRVGAAETTTRLVERIKARGSSARAWFEEQPKGVRVGAAATAVLVLVLLAAAGAITLDSDRSTGKPADDTAVGGGPVTAGSPTTDEASSAGVSQQTEDPFQAALMRSQQAESYRFDAVLMLRSGAKTAELHLTGWLEGADRGLTIHSGGDLVATTTVIDGVATIDDGSGPREIPLEEAGPAPGFDLLEQIEIIETTDNEIKGNLSGEALADFQLGDIPPKEGSIVVSYTQYIDGYLMRDPDGAWEMNVTFSGYGEEVRSS